VIKGATIATSAAKQFIVGRIRGTISDGPEDDALVARLVTLATGTRIHTIPLPDSVPLPAFGMSRYGGGNDAGPIGQNLPTVATTIRMQVKAICEGYDESPIEEPAAILDELLNGRVATIDVRSADDLVSYGTFYVECSRESELLQDLPEEPDGSVFQHIGGIYAFYVSRVG
jgi:hypothetical protein